MATIKRLLVANRGEIACRVIRACKKMGIESVAVFSDADKNAQHVQQADIAVSLGGSAANESYLVADKIIAAAKKVKADAIHPGYGFLSESTELISRCEKEDIIFVGPSVESIAAMGSKIEAKAIAVDLQIPTVPGYNGEKQDLETLEAEGLKIGFPMLIKASAGGGGKGMRIVNEASEFSEALKLARQESMNAFGDDRVLLEKYIVRPRHIEVQLLGDTHGNVVHIFDRECSIQRNYQKVIEEAPVSKLSDEVRQSLFDCAVRLGKHLSYRGAGTVEFIFDADTQEAYFLEMNTRLQVEHPVTELVTGVDLVENQIRVARGEALAFDQSELTATGHAIEARVNAEDPANNYLPEIGTITFYKEPNGEGMRVDSGVAQGSEITPFYDSMVAKIIAFGETRGLAAQRLLHGLNEYTIGGVKTNQEFLTSILTRPAFHQELTTQFITKEFPEGWQPWGEELHQAIAAAAYVYNQELRTDVAYANTPWQAFGAWRLTEPSGTGAVTRLWLDGDLEEFAVAGKNGEYQVAAGEEGENNYAISLGCQQREGKSFWYVQVDGTRRSLELVIDGMRVSLSSQRLKRSFQFVSLEEAQLGEAAALNKSSNTIRAVMPGLITDVLVKEGDKVEEGDIGVVMEAMKLIHNLPCPMSGTVLSVQCKAGDDVADGALLVEIEPEETE